MVTPHQMAIALPAPSMARSVEPAGPLLTVALEIVSTDPKGPLAGRSAVSTLLVVAAESKYVHSSVALPLGLISTCGRRIASALAFVVKTVGSSTNAPPGARAAACSVSRMVAVVCHAIVAAPEAVTATATSAAGATGVLNDCGGSNVALSAGLTATSAATSVPARARVQPTTAVSPR